MKIRRYVNGREIKRGELKNFSHAAQINDVLRAANARLGAACPKEKEENKGKAS
jgi:hypothetical protein